MIKYLVVAVALMPGINALAQQFEKDTILFSGSSDKHINLVILSDGYTNNELPKFVVDATNFTTAFFDEIPFSNYKKYFNVFIVKVPSNQTGASHPGTATDVKEPAHPVLSVDNYFGSTFDYSGIHRLLVATKSSTITTVLAANYPDFDQALILANSPYYGGSGGFYTVASTHPSSGQIAIHELGHSFSALKDEYWAGDIYAAEGINMTKQTNPLLVRWKNWISTNGIGIFQYCCGGNSSQWYKPHLDCLMQYLGSPFCSVCVQGTIERIHTLVTPIISFYPQNNSITPSEYPVKFKLSLIPPDPNTLKRGWLLNNSFFRKNIDSVYVYDGSLVTGNNTLKITVEDTTQLLRVDDHTSIHVSVISWSINKTTTGIKKISGSSYELTVDFYPNPVTDFVNIKVTGEPGGKLRLEIYDLQGKKYKNFTLSSKEVNSINLNDLDMGVYVAKIFVGNNLYTTSKIVRR